MYILVANLFTSVIAILKFPDLVQILPWRLGILICIILSLSWSIISIPTLVFSIITSKKFDRFTPPLINRAITKTTLVILFSIFGLMALYIAGKSIEDLREGSYRYMGDCNVEEDINIGRHGIITEYYLTFSGSKIRITRRQYESLKGLVKSVPWRFQCKSPVDIEYLMHTGVLLKGNFMRSID